MRIGVYKLLAALVLLSALGLCEAPITVTPCQLQSDPAAYNHKLVEVTAFVSHGFENFTLRDPTCASWPPVWLEYGGTTSSDTMYCCGFSPSHSRPHELVIEDIPVPLVQDDEFNKLEKLIQPPFRAGQHDAMAHAIVQGRFFAGRVFPSPKGPFWGGYGHMGCCSLLAITQIISVDPQNRTDLDYNATSAQPRIDKAGCGYQFLTPIEPYSLVLQAQSNADAGKESWAFDDPARVAANALAQLAADSALSALKETKSTPGLKYFESDPSKKNDEYMLVVSKPYWLSFYAKNPQRVAWVVAAAYRTSCDKKTRKSVTRIK